MTVLSELNKPLIPLYNGLEKWIRSIAKELPEETDWTDSTKGSWYESIYMLRKKKGVKKIFKFFFYMQVPSPTSTCH